jgi:hypothetical protein
LSFKLRAKHIGRPLSRPHPDRRCKKIQEENRITTEELHRKDKSCRAKKEITRKD